MRPIDANALMEVFEEMKNVADDDYRFPFSIIAQTIRDAKNIDYAPVMHGERVHEKNGFMYYLAECSVCGELLVSSNYNYCPYCGAKMDGGKTDV